MAVRQLLPAKSIDITTIIVATAAISLVLNALKPRVYKYEGSVSMFSGLGPKGGGTSSHSRMTSHVLKASANLNINARNMKGFAYSNVMYLNLAHQLAPSIFADSNTVLGTEEKPPIIISITNGVQVQASTRIIDVKASRPYP